MVLTHPEVETITREELIARAHEMIPTLRERAAATEAARRLLPETVQAFTDAGFFRIVQPRRFGGFELGLDVLEEVVVEVGRGCGSSAWALAILGGHGWLAGLFNEEGQCELFGNDGHVKTSSIDAPYDDTAVGKCVLRAMGAVIVPSFEGQEETVQWEVDLTADGPPPEKPAGKDKPKKPGK